MFTRPDWHWQKCSSVVNGFKHFGQLEVGLSCFVGFDERFFRFDVGFLSIFIRIFVSWMGFGLWFYDN